MSIALSNTLFPYVITDCKDIVVTNDVSYGSDVTETSGNYALVCFLINKATQGDDVKELEPQSSYVNPTTFEGELNAKGYNEIAVFLVPIVNFSIASAIVEEDIVYDVATSSFYKSNGPTALPTVIDSSWTLIEELNIEDFEKAAFMNGQANLYYSVENILVLCDIEKVLSEKLLNGKKDCIDFCSLNDVIALRRKYFEIISNFGMGNYRKAQRLYEKIAGLISSNNCC